LDTERSLVRIPDGRVLDVLAAGPLSRDAVFFHTGTPSGPEPYLPGAEAAAARGLRFIGYGRPGYGDSTRQPGRSVADCVPDVTAIADALGIDRLYVIGWSGGGPHALATAARLPDRVISCATIASVAPIEAAGLDWLAGMGPENIEEFHITRAGPTQLEAYLVRESATFGTVTGPEIADALGGLIDEVDRAALTGEFADYMAACTQEAVRTGIWGWFDDDLAFDRDWGVDLGAISVPVTIWQGAHDKMVPFDHGRWLAAHVAGARAELRLGEGHVSLVLNRFGEILDGLLADAPDAAAGVAPG
jgi:pimeloyl-ACP methyl ester carboxylesterase